MDGGSLFVAGCSSCRFSTCKTKHVTRVFSKASLTSKVCGRTSNQRDQPTYSACHAKPKAGQRVMNAFVRTVTRNFTLDEVTHVQNPSWKRKYGSVSRNEMTVYLSFAMPPFTASTTHWGTVPSSTTVSVDVPVTLVRFASPVAPSIRKTKTVILQFCGQG
jgi:hypothetical protein